MARTSTICFNVGGNKYEVSRSLLEHYPQTLMAKMASETWSRDGDSKKGDGVGDAEDSLFIEGDGERFKHVLDFMRHGRISLPGGKVSKSSVLNDLEYYGITNVDPTLVQIEWDVGGAVAHLEKVETASKEAKEKQWLLWESTVITSYFFEMYKETKKCFSLYLTLSPGEIEQGYRVIAVPFQMEDDRTGKTIIVGACLLESECSFLLHTLYGLRMTSAVKGTHMYEVKLCPV